MTGSLRPPRSSLLLAGGLALLVAGALAGANLVRDLPTDTARAVFAWGCVVVLGFSAVATLPFWRRLDEAAREAHKAAWFWGGGLGFVFAAMAVPLLMAAPDSFALPSLTDRADSAGRAADAVLLALGLQAFAYGAGWLIWWMRKQ